MSFLNEISLGLASREVEYCRTWGRCSCFFGEFSDRCVIHAEGYEERAYTPHYWHRLSNYWHKLSNRATFEPIVCLLCGYKAVENDVLFANCVKREPE